MVRLKIATLTWLIVATFALPSAFASVLSLEVGNAAVDGLTKPYGTVTVTRNSTTSASIFVESNHALGYLFGDGGSFAMNVNGNFALPAVFNTTQPTQINGGAPGAPSFTVETNKNISDFGVFELVLKNFDGATHAYKTLSFDLTGIGTNWMTDDVVLETNATGFKAAAHLFTYTIESGDNFVDNNLTGFVGDGTNGFVIPEPTSVVVWSFAALSGLALLGRRRNKIGR